MKTHIMKKILKTVFIITIIVIFIVWLATNSEILDIIFYCLFIWCILYYWNKTDKLEKKVDQLEDWILWWNEKYREFYTNNKCEWEENMTKKPYYNIYEIIMHIKWLLEDKSELEKNIEKLEKKSKSTKQK